MEGNRRFPARSERVSFFRGILFEARQVSSWWSETTSRFWTTNTARAILAANFRTRLEELGRSDAAAAALNGCSALSTLAARGTPKPQYASLADRDRFERSAFLPAQNHTFSEVWVSPNEAICPNQRTMHYSVENLGAALFSRIVDLVNEFVRGKSTEGFGVIA